MKDNFTNYILGDQILIGNNPEKKRIILTYQITLLILFVGLIYIFFDLLMGIVDTWPIYLVFSLIMFSNLFLVRNKKYFTAKNIILITSNLVVYVFYTRESYGTGAFLLFFPLITGAFSLFDYNQKVYSFIYSFLSFILFLVATLTSFTILPSIQLDPVTVQTNFIINFFIAGFASIFNIIFLMRINNKSEENLLSKEADLKKLTDKLQESNLRFELALSASEGGVWDWDIKSKKIFHSQKWGKKFSFDQYESPEWTLDDTLQKIHPDDRERVGSAINAHFNTKKSFVEEYRLLDINHDYRWIVDYGQAIWDEDNNPSRMVGFMVDITERKRAEQRITVQNEMLAKTNSELDRFVYSTSHDLRSPLMSVLGLIQLMKNEKSLPEIRNYIEMMEARINQLDNFIQDIIHYSRNTRVDIIPESFNLQDTINESLEGLRFIDGMERIQVELNINGNDIITDKSRLKIVINNLISNAIKYQKPGVKGLIKVDVIESNDHFTIKVQDNGEGIKEEKLENIFDMFYRASESSTGSGLGLYIVKEMIEKIEGTIDVKSVYGEGTLFTITLPKSIKKKFNIGQFMAE